MLVAIPSEAPGGLDAAISEHFGHCAAFTIVTIDGGEVGDAKVLANTGHEQGGCMAPVMFLKKMNVEALVAGGMGARPLAGFQEVGITVFSKEDAATVGEAAKLFADGNCREFSPAQVCGGGGGGGGGHCGGHGHDHGPVEREPIEGKADICKDRVVTLEFDLKDSDGEAIDSSKRAGPMVYLHGHGNIPEGLEKALDGLEAGAQKVVEIPAADAYGEHHPENVIELPRDQLPPDAGVGAMLMAQDEQGRPVRLTLVELGDETAKLDANHPLAGKDLVFDVTVVKVEQATATELQHGHIH